MRQNADKQNIAKQNMNMICTKYDQQSKGANLQ
jgi:hypothetical protein